MFAHFLFVCRVVHADQALKALSIICLFILSLRSFPSTLVSPGITVIDTKYSISLNKCPPLNIGSPPQDHNIKQAPPPPK